MFGSSVYMLAMFSAGREHSSKTSSKSCIRCSADAWPNILDLMYLVQTSSNSSFEQFSFYNNSAMQPTDALMFLEISSKTAGPRS